MSLNISDTAISSDDTTIALNKISAITYKPNFIGIFLGFCIFGLILNLLRIFIFLGLEGNLNSVFLGVLSIIILYLIGWFTSTFKLIVFCEGNKFTFEGRPNKVVNIYEEVSKKLSN